MTGQHRPPRQSVETYPALYVILYICGGLLLLFCASVAFHLTSNSHNLLTSVLAYSLALIAGFVFMIFAVARLKAQSHSQQKHAWRGLIGGVFGSFLGVLGLFFLPFSGRPLDLVFWAAITVPYLLTILAITGAIVGWLISKYVKRITSLRVICILVGIIVGILISGAVAGISARCLDHIFSDEYKTSLYGYYYVKCAAAIGATSGAMAGIIAALLRASD
jgi:hypothetical protein